jgi:uncharacterized DUF497 family protein
MKRKAIVGFDWDEGNRAKCQKHGVSLAEIEAVFHSPHRLVPDPAHSAEEERLLAIGKGDGPREVFVAFTLRESAEGQLIRPISARYMHREEIESYEEATTQTDQ